MITVNIDKAKTIAHDARRIARAKEFEPFDAIIMKQIPGSNATAAEVERKKIRDKYSEIQVQMDGAKTPEELKSLMMQLPK